MSGLSRWFSYILKFALVSLLALLALALGWTVLQVASIAEPPAASGTTAARQNAYRATATAISLEAEPASLRAAPRLIRLQQSLNKATPAATPSGGEIAALPSDTGFALPEFIPPPTPPGQQRLEGIWVPTPVPEIARAHQLINIILLGSDDELTEDNFIRTDTMIVVSLNLDTGTVSMLSLPRDLFVYIPHGIMERLNSAFGWGAQIDWQPDGGFGLLRQTIFYNFGINVHYYARVNFSGFEALIDRLGGVELAVDCGYRDYYAADGAVRTLRPGYYTFTGSEALWYARTRRNSDDFDRGRRQQQILRALWRRVQEQGLISALPSLWQELTAIVETDIPFDVMLRLLPAVINLDLSDIENFTLSRKYHTREWITPDGAKVELPLADRIAYLMRDFYRPPAPYQMTLAGPSIAVYNGSGGENWDIVASERLRWAGYNAVALGQRADGAEYDSNLLIDYVATEKGSLAPQILSALNMEEEQARREPKADRQYDYEVIIGRDYQSCTYSVLPLAED